MIVSTHTVPNPKAMVVKSLDTDLTFAAMFSTIVAGYLTLSTFNFGRSRRAQQTVFMLFLISIDFLTFKL